MLPMKKLFFTYITALFIITNCATKPTPQEESGLDLPAWVLNPNIEGQIAAVGIAPKSRGGLQFQIPQAEADARANIAALIETEVSRMSKDALRAARISEREEVENVFSQVTKNLVKKVPLRGAKRINLYRDKIDGNLYIHMAIDNELVRSYFTDTIDSYSKALQATNLSRELINSSEQAVKNLYDELEEELND
jgi:hypothetical protein